MKAEEAEQRRKRERERGKEQRECEREETSRGTANFHRKAAGFKLYA